VSKAPAALAAKNEATAASRSSSSSSSSAPAAAVSPAASAAAAAYAMTLTTFAIELSQTFDAVLAAYEAEEKAKAAAEAEVAQAALSQGRRVQPRSATQGILLVPLRHPIFHQHLNLLPDATEL